LIDEVGMATFTRRRTALATLLACVVAPFLPIATCAPAHASTTASVRLSTYDAALLHDINAARKAHGRKPLAAAAGTTDVAHRWSCALRRAGELSHRPHLDGALVRHGSAAWSVLGENVGMSSLADPHVMFRMYMNSPPHRANILDRHYRYIGIHTERSHGMSWNTLDFVDAYSTVYGDTRATC
jgi:uncharacterized protein YkwD